MTNHKNFYKENNIFNEKLNSFFKEKLFAWLIGKLSKFQKKFSLIIVETFSRRKIYESFKFETQNIARKRMQLEQKLS